jgi:hypothetical protein
MKAGDAANRDVMLAKAAKCIFSARATGSGKAEDNEPGTLSLVNVAPAAARPVAPAF